MKKISVFCLLALHFVVGTAFSMEGEFDRSAESAKFVALAANGTRGDLLLASKEIYVSGLGDDKLSAALSERLLRDYKTLKSGKREDSQYGQWLVKALASTGTEQASATVTEVRAGAGVQSIKNEAGDELGLIEWHRKKNVLMASRANHQAGQDERNSQLLNLLKSDDFTFKHLAADRISWEKRMDARLTDEMAAQLPLYMDDADMGNRLQAKTMGLYAKMLGYSGDAKYRPTLEQVTASKAGMAVKKHANEALKRLQ